MVLGGSSTATEAFETETEHVDALRMNRLLISGAS